MLKIFPSGNISIDGLIETKAIERAETNLFRSYDEILQEAGPWAKFFDTLVMWPLSASVTGQLNGLSWEKRSRDFSHKPNMRYERWIKVRRGNDIFIAMFTPHVYSDGPNLKSYTDYRFVVATNNHDFLTTVILHQDDILSGNYEGQTWNDAST